MLGDVSHSIPFLLCIPLIQGTDRYHSQFQTTRPVSKPMQTMMIWWKPDGKFGPCLIVDSPMSCVCLFFLLLLGILCCLLFLFCCLFRLLFCWLFSLLLFLGMSSMRKKWVPGRNPSRLPAWFLWRYGFQIRSPQKRETQWKHTTSSWRDLNNTECRPDVNGIVSQHLFNDLSASWRLGGGHK